MFLGLLVTSNGVLVKPVGSFKVTRPALCNKRSARALFVGSDGIATFAPLGKSFKSLIF